MSNTRTKRIQKGDSVNAFQLQASIDVNFVRSMNPLWTPGCKILVLGSMPGAASIAAQEYYAHPHNLFWSFIESILGIARALPYSERRAQLVQAGIAVWDVLATCERPGSLDSEIRAHSERANPIAQWALEHRIEKVLLNGQRAAQCLRRLFPKWDDSPNIARTTLPSTSPANASIPKATKLAAWSAALRTRT